jgi:hypothetical protein
MPELCRNCELLGLCQYKSIKENFDEGDAFDQINIQRAEKFAVENHCPELGLNPTEPNFTNSNSMIINQASLKHLGKPPIWPESQDEPFTPASVLSDSNFEIGKQKLLGIIENKDKNGQRRPSLHGLSHLSGLTEKEVRKILEDNNL